MKLFMEIFWDEFGEAISSGIGYLLALVAFTVIAAIVLTTEWIGDLLLISVGLIIALVILMTIYECISRMINVIRKFRSTRRNQND